MTTPYTCPLCGGPIEIVTDGMIGDVTAAAFTYRGHRFTQPLRHTRLAPFAACCACEFCIEVRPRPAGYTIGDVLR